MRISAENALLDSALQNPETSQFAQFELDLGAAIDPETGGYLFPELEGKHTPLWSITSNGGSEADRQREIAKAEAEAHQNRVERYAKQVANGEGVFESPDNPTCEVCGRPQSWGHCDACNETTQEEYNNTPPDEWEHFWCGASPTKRGFVSRAKLNM